MKLKLKLLSPLLIAVAHSAIAQPLNYSQVSVEVKAGVLVLPGQIFAPGVGANPAPHVWYNLDQDNTVKPAKWRFVNPVGPTVLTTGMRNRWASLDPAGTPAAGTRLTKATGPYWEVPLDTISFDALARYDVLSLTVNRTLSLNPGERDKLRRYMDNGGVLWVDLVDDPTANIFIDVFNPLPFPFGWIGSNAALEANTLHPLLRFPNQISLNELTYTDYPDVVNRAVTRPFTTTTYNQTMEPLQRWLIPDSAALQPVAGTSDGNTISIGKVGHGFMVLTSRGVSANLNRGLPNSGAAVFNVNRGFYGLKVPADAAFSAAAKLALNIVSMGGLSTSRNGGPGHKGSNRVDLTAPLLRNFSADQGAVGAFDTEQQPALYKGRAIVTKGNFVYVYDTRPDRDLDGDGNSDDGLVNPIGTQADLIWMSGPLGSRLSAPTVVEVPNTVLTNPLRIGARPTEQIWVTDELSRVHILDLNTDGVGVVPPAWPEIGMVTPPSGTVPSSSWPFAPVVHESVAFITDTANLTGFAGGRIWMIDLDTASLATTNGGDWKITASSRMPEPSAAAAVGMIPIQDGSGGNDIVAYVPTKPSTGLTPRPAGMTSVWLGARSESPIRTEFDPVGGVLSLTTRASYFGLPIFLDPGATSTPLKSLGLKISIVSSTGTPLNAIEMNTVLGGASAPSQATNGVLLLQNVNAGSFDLDGKQTPQTTDDVSFRLDYTVEWGKAGTGAFQPQFENYVRGNLELPDDSRNTREVIGSPAMAADGTVYVVSSFRSGTDGGGSVFGFRENKGPGNFSMLSRFEIYDALSFNLNNSTGAADQVVMPPVLTDEDQLVQLIPFLNLPIRTWRFTSGAVLQGDSIFVMAGGVKNVFTGSPTGTLLSFKTASAAPNFQIEGQDTNFTIVQPDPALSLNKAQPEQYSVLQPGQFTVEPIPGTSRSRVVLTSLMNTTRGRVRDSINASLPLIIRRGGQTDTLIEPEALFDDGRMIAGRAGGRWNPLVWYMVFNGYQPGAGPVIAGQTLYQGGASVLPSIITGTGFDLKGLIFAMDTVVSPNDEFLIANSRRPWTSQLNSFLGTNFNNVRPSNSVKWPQFKGIRDIDDLRIRILQATLEEDGVRAIAAGDDSLAVLGPTTLYGFGRSDFLVIDSGRVSRIDPAGNPLWTTDQTFQAGKDGPTTSFGSAKPLSEPNRMYSTGDNGYWIVDTGNNRVLRVDGAARELRTVEKFKIDPIFSPDGVNDQGSAAGMSAAETLKLRRPKDVLVYESLVDRSVPGANPFSNAAPLERWTHMLIADSGNNRVVELVDRYRIDPATGRNLGLVQFEDPPLSGKFVTATSVLYWHSPEELSGKDYRYNSIARTIQDVGGNRHTVVALGFGNVEPGTGTLGLDVTNQDADRTSGYGGIVLYDGRDSTVIREFLRPAIAQNTFIVEDPANDGQYIYGSPQVNQPPRMQKLVGLSSATVRYVDYNGSLVLSVMVTDATGVYELVQDTSQPSKPWVVRWMLPTEAYVGMRHPRGAGPFNFTGMGLNPKGFRPMYAKRLDSGEVLIVNGYAGRLIDGSEFLGEVALIDGTFAGAGTQLEDPGYSLSRRNAGFGRLSVKFEVPPVQGVRGIIAPVFAHRQ